MTGGAMTAAALMGSKDVFAIGPEPAIGLQLYSVRKLLEKDYVGTLQMVSQIGYRNVEAAGFYNHTAAEVKHAMGMAQLNCFSAHYSLADLLKDVEGTITFAKEIGLHWVICSSPSVADPSRFANAPGGAWQAMHSSMTADDWKWNAEQFNRIGHKMKSRGLQFGYHNHTMEFRDLGGSTGYDVLLKDTDPTYVTLELDCGWVTAAGKDPITYLTQYPGRISMLHIKDLKPAVAGKAPGERVSTVLGKGTIDYKPIFAAAKNAGIKHYFVEQEEFDGDPMQELKEDYQYLHAIRD